MTDPANPYDRNESLGLDEPTTTGTGGSLAPGTRTATPTPGYPTGTESVTYGAVGTNQPTSGSIQSDDGNAKAEARRVADTATSAGADVAHTAKDQANQVVAETKQQAASLLDTVRTEVSEQAGTQQQRIADAVHSLSKELGSMASSSSESGWLTDLAHEGSRRGGELAHWLQDHEPADALEAVRSYARRRPGTFLALCGLAGVLAGRITRSTVATRTSLDSPDDDRPRAVTQGASYSQSYPVIETTAPAAPSTGTLGTETSTVTVPTTAGPDPYGRGGDPTR